MVGICIYINDLCEEILWFVLLLNFKILISIQYSLKNPVSFRL